MGFFSNLWSGAGAGIGYSLSNHIMNHFNKGQNQQQQEGQGMQGQIVPSQGQQVPQIPMSGYPQQVMPMGGQMPMEGQMYPQPVAGQMYLQPVAGQMYPQQQMMPMMGYQPKRVTDRDALTLIQLAVPGIQVLDCEYIDDCPPYFTHICGSRTMREDPICQIPPNIVNVQNVDGVMYAIPVFYCGRCHELVIYAGAYRDVY
jgi:hypothetical protein